MHDGTDALAGYLHRQLGRVAGTELELEQRHDQQ
jgi:hypothetical protein